MPLATHLIEKTLTAARRRLLAARVHAGHWEGRLSSSGLSTATASFALALLDRARGREESRSLTRGGLAWLADHQNVDGGWGDTVDSPSNISTTMLCWAALGASGDVGASHHSAEARAEDWLRRRAGGLAPAALARAVGAVYGEDRTFSAPILTMCALAGRLGERAGAWEHVAPLPFELAACPRSWFRRLGLPVVSYALPALIAIGQARHHHRRPGNPLARLARALSRGRTLRVLEAIQPSSGGFLEATPLTSFVVMSLASIGQVGHPVVRQGREFLTVAVRDDGSWPIDSNLATWLTTLSVNALAAGPALADLPTRQRAALLSWLLDQQYQREHPYTGSPPGGWAWTDLPGGVPDADDTAGALLAVARLLGDEQPLAALRPRTVRAAQAGVRWLLDLQNRDGGIPTFCRGWGRLPFDRSSPDLTAHALRAWSTWREAVPGPMARRIAAALDKAARFLIDTQAPSGSWTPLWFGNQQAPAHTNPVYGTSRVLLAAEGLAFDSSVGEAWIAARQRGIAWLLEAQNADGGWGGAPRVSSSIEESALAMESLAGFQADRAVVAAVERGCAWLVERTRAGEHFEPAPIGLYFAKLWYHEQLYPLAFTVAALERAGRALN